MALAQADPMIVSLLGDTARIRSVRNTRRCSPIAGKLNASENPSLPPTSRKRRRYNTASVGHGIGFFLMKHPHGESTPRGKKPPVAEPPPAPRSVAFLPPPAPSRANLTDATPRGGARPEQLARHGAHSNRHSCSLTNITCELSELTRSESLRCVRSNPHRRCDGPSSNIIACCG
jgi:hypothetical protein